MSADEEPNTEVTDRSPLGRPVGPTGAEHLLELERRTWAALTSEQDTDAFYDRVLSQDMVMVLPGMVLDRKAALITALVVNEPADAERGSAAVLFDVLNRQDDHIESAILSGRCEWSVADPVTDMLGLVVRAVAPVEFAVRVLVPAGWVLPVLEVAGEDGLLAITTRSRANSWTGLRQLLRDVVLVGCSPSQGLAVVDA